MDNFEDQFRRMILQGDSSQRIQHQNDASGRPTVRLPPGINTPANQPSHIDNHVLGNRRVADNTYPSAMNAPPGLSRNSQRSNHPNGTQHSGDMLPNHRTVNPHQTNPQRANHNASQKSDRDFHRPPQSHARSLYDPRQRGSHHPLPNDFFSKQGQYVETLVARELPAVQMSLAERGEKESFRAALQSIIHRLCASGQHRLPDVELMCFGSFQTGFASAGSDMDLVIVSQDSNFSANCFSLDEHDLPRVLERELLDFGFGARLLTRTRVPIIKICESPSAELLEKLREERAKWDALPQEQKYPHLFPDNSKDGDEQGANLQKDGEQIEGIPQGPLATTILPLPGETKDAHTSPKTDENQPQSEPRSAEDQASKPDGHKTWTRQRQAGPLDFPSKGVGIQCDINFFNPLGLHNTQLLRCYSLCDARVQPMILFVKQWAKKRGINSSYSGTLSSYGYVLMVLHYLVNVVQPPVLTNLQAPWRPGPGYTQAGQSAIEVDGWKVDFWRNEDEIADALRRGLMSPNRDSLGMLLAGFFTYYSSQGGPPQFHWMQECLSLRTVGGIVTKEAKGWVKAVTEEGEGKRVQHRYLFCIEDPFEHSHNVARTVTHNGIVAIRDEFRRARRILMSVGHSNGNDAIDDLLADLTEAEAITIQSSPHKQRNSHSTANPNVGGPRNQSVDHGRHAPHKSSHPGVGQAHRAQQAPNVTDDKAFPSLGSSKTYKARQTPQKKREEHNFGEVSGDQAKRVLEDLRRRRLEQQAELTAMGAANAVLGDSD